MHFLFLTHYFPPEVNAPATRTYEHARRWVRDGHEVTVLTCFPSHPHGTLYPGWRMRFWQRDEMDGITVLRVPTLLAPNKGAARRILNHLSYMAAAIPGCLIPKRPDVVVSTSPQFFCGLAGYAVSRLRRVPWVLEIRDLWPESISAVGAIRNRAILRTLETIEGFMYRKADRIVPLIGSFKDHILRRGKAVAPESVVLVTNGVDPERFENAKPAPRPQGVDDDTFLVGYVGTHGMAHALDVVLKAAQLLEGEDVAFLLAGGGAERERLVAERDGHGLTNVHMIEQRPASEAPALLSCVDASLVHLRRIPLFKAALPSKMFEAMAAGNPLLLGLEGECKDLVEAEECGVAFEPENPRALADAVLALKNDPELAARMGENGARLARTRFNRDLLAARFMDMLQRLV